MSKEKDVRTEQAVKLLLQIFENNTHRGLTISQLGKISELGNFIFPAMDKLKRENNISGTRLKDEMFYRLEV